VLSGRGLCDELITRPAEGQAGETLTPSNKAVFFMLSARFEHCLVSKLLVMLDGSFLLRAVQGSRQQAAVTLCVEL